jgi:hypothetical protein
MISSAFTSSGLRPAAAMGHLKRSNISALAILAVMIHGCDRIDPSQKGPVSDGAPSETELQPIAYLSSSNGGPGGRKLFDRLDRAKNCKDFELAMRWNRPPNIEGGMFHKKIVYLTDTLPSDLPKDSEIVLSGKIDRGDVLPSGSARWYLRMQDGTLVQAVETSNYWQKQQQTDLDAHPGEQIAIVRPETPGRKVCAHGLYQGLNGKDPHSDHKLPLVSVLFAIDRDN